MEPVLSIIIPVYNVEKYLPGCLESALAQDIPGLEIICVNDGSTDSSPEILQAFAARDERIAVIDKPNAGYGAAMNNGLRAARGRYVGILESDDKVCDGAWQTLLDVAIANELDMVRGSYIRCRSGAESPYDPHKGAASFCSSTQKALPFDEVFDPANYPLCYWVNPSLWTGLYRRAFLEEEGIWFTETPGASYQDTAFGFKTWALAKRVMLLDVPVIYYNRDNESSSSNSKSKVFALCDETAECARFIDERDAEERLGAPLAALRFRTYQWNSQRVSDEFKEEFASVMWKELGDDYRAGRIDRTLFKRSDYDLVKRMTNGTPEVSVVFAAGASAGTEAVASRLENLVALTDATIEIICVPYASPAEGGAQESEDVAEALAAASANALAELFDRYRASDERLSVLDACADLASALNAGLSHASGTYLLFTGVADRLDAPTLGYFVGNAERNDLDVILSRWLRKIGSAPSLAGDPLLDWPRPSRICSARDARGYVLRFDTALLSNKMFRASFLADNQLRFHSGGDPVGDFAQEALSLAERAMVLNGRVVTRRYPTGAPHLDFTRPLEVAREVEDLLRSQGAYEENALDYARWLSDLYECGMAERTAERNETAVGLRRTQAELEAAKRRLDECSKKLGETQKRLTETEKRLQMAQASLQAVRTSHAFKVGHAITAPARALKKSLGKAGK